MPTFTKDIDDRSWPKGGQPTAKADGTSSQSSRAAIGNGSCGRGGSTARNATLATE